MMHLVCLPTIGAAASIFSTKILPQYGRSFMQASSPNMLLVGIVGVVHGILSISIAEQFKTERKITFTAMLIGNALSGAVLVGLTLAATKVNLIAGGLTLAGFGALAVTNFAISYIYLKVYDSCCTHERRRNA